MDVQVRFCAYSYHTKRFVNTGHTEGAAFYLLRLQIEGSADVYLDERWQTAEAGDLVLVKPGDSYGIKVNAGASPNVASGDYYVLAMGPWLDAWWNERERPRKARINPDERLIQLWRQLIAEKFRADGENRRLSGHLFQALCLMIDRALDDKVVQQRKLFNAAKIHGYVEANATKPFKLQDVAKFTGLSVSRLSALYKECYGKSIFQQALEVRLSIALERMRYSRLTLKQVAETSGFGTYAYFHRVFRDKYGVSPKQYMERNGL